MEVEVEPLSKNIYAKTSFVIIKYKKETEKLTFEIIALYSIPVSKQKTLTSDFGLLEEFWEPDGSIFRFSVHGWGEKTFIFW